MSFNRPEWSQPAGRGAPEGILRLLATDPAESKGRGSLANNVCSFAGCGACKNLKGDIVENGDALVEASKHYLMVSIDGNDNKELETNFQPDGTYVPRILMANPRGEVQPELTAPGGNPKYKFFYTSADQARVFILICVCGWICTIIITIHTFRLPRDSRQTMEC